MQPDLDIRAIIWDYDGTLVDTREKNFNVTRRIVNAIAAVDPETIPALRTMENYVRANTNAANWREFYTREFGLTEEQTDAAGKAWSAFQQSDSTRTPVFEGIREVFSTLSPMRHGVVSQNSRATIISVLREHDLMRHFDTIVGYEEVDIRRQKPAPDGLLSCIQEMVSAHSGVILYIGDHETDALCAFNTAASLKESGSGVQIRSVALLHAQDRGTSGWRVKPDYDAQRAEDIIRIVQHLQGTRTTVDRNTT
jgi:HAD superfamily hydrolase (TIGR01549 family)